METVTIVVGIVLVLVIIGAVFGTYKSFHTKDCCCKDKNCSSGATQHCNIRKSKDN